MYCLIRLQVDLEISNRGIKRGEMIRPWYAFVAWRLITYIYPLFVESIVNVKWCNSYLVTARMNYMITIMLCLCV